MQRVMIKYLFHSGFSVIVDNCLLLFDYFQGKGYKHKHEYPFPVPEYLTDVQNIYIFASHNHFDHFSPEIFQWKTAIPNIQYIVSSDCRGIEEESNITIMRPYENVKLHDINISTFGSTDAGVSFLVDIEGFKIFHAGDLNWWHWMNESTAEEIDQAEILFKKEIDMIPNNQIDVAFFPVDPKQGQFYYLGGAYFAERVEPKLLIPMHFGNKYSITLDFNRIIANIGVTSVVIKHKGQIIFYDKS